MKFSTKKCHDCISIEVMSTILLPTNEMRNGSHYHAKQYTVNKNLMVSLKKVLSNNELLRFRFFYWKFSTKHFQTSNPTTAVINNPEWFTDFISTWRQNVEIKHDKNLYNYKHCLKSIRIHHLNTRSISVSEWTI